MSHIQVADSGIAMNKTLMKQRQPETILAGQVFGVTSPQFQDISIEKTWPKSRRTVCISNIICVCVSAKKKLQNDVFFHS